MNMKKIIAFYLILFFTLPLAAEIKVALIGDKDKVDLLTAELSGVDDVALLERAQIEKVIKEQKLSAVNGAELGRYFPHADAIGIVSPVSVSFFNAKNGFRLGRLPIDDALQGAETVKLLKKTTDKESILLSIGFVTLSDIPERLRPEVARMVLELDNALMNTDKIQLLEREHLSAVLQEREVTETTHTLIPSLQVIRCAFSQGDTAEKINLKLSLTDATGSVLFEKEYADITAGGTPAQDITANLKTTAINLLPKSRKEEAELYRQEFYAAYNRINTYTTADTPGFSELRQYVDAAYVLAPENPDIARDKIFYELCFITKKNITWAEKITILTRFVRDAKKFRQDHPQYMFAQKPYPNTGFCEHPVLKNLHPLFYLGNFESVRPTDNEGAVLSQLEDEITTMHLAIYKQTKKNIPFELKDVKTFPNLLEYRNFNRFMMDSLPRFDSMKALQRAWDTDLANLMAAVKLLKNNPEFGKNIQMHQSLVGNPMLFPEITGRLRGKYRTLESWELLKTILNTELPKLEKLSQEINLPRLTRHYLELKALRDYLNSPGTLDDFERCYTELVENLVKENGFKPKLDDTASYRLVWSTVYFRLNRYQVRERQKACLEKLIAKHTNFTDKEMGLHALSSRDPAIPAKYIQQLAYPAMCDLMLTRKLQNYTNYLFNNLRKNAGRIEELNSAFKIKNIPMPKGRSVRFVAASYMEKDSIYLLGEDFSGYLQVLVYSINKEQIQKLPAPEISGNDFLPYMRGRKGTGYKPALYAADNKVFIGGQKMIAVLDIATGKWQTIRDIPGENVFGFHWDAEKEKLYYLCGGHWRILSMHSCKLDGSDRKTYFDGKTGSTLFGRQDKGEITGFFPIAGNKLLFTFNATMKQLSKCALITFDKKTEEFTLLREYRYSRMDMCRDGALLLGMAGESMFRLDPAHPEQEPELFFIPYSDRNTDTPGNYRYRIFDAKTLRRGPDQLHLPAAVAEDRYLASSSRYCNYILDLKDPENSPLLLLPECISVFYLPEKKQFIFPRLYTSHTAIHIVKLKEEK